MNQYEIMLLTGADLDEAARAAIVDRAKDAITRGGGTWIDVNDWGRRKMTYEIAKQGEAHYQVLNFDADGAALDEAVRLLRITDGVLRAMAVKRPAPRPEGVPLELISAEEIAEREERPRGRGGRGGGFRGR